MKRRWVIVGTTCIALIGAGIIVRAQRNHRRLVKRAAVYRTRAEQGDAKSQFALGAKLLFPLALFIAPAMGIVLLGPAALSLIKNFKHMLG